MHDTIAKQIPQLARGQVWCRSCGRTQRTDSAEALRSGWPKCCGYTMTIDACGQSVEILTEILDMSNKELIERLNKPCGRTTGHGESCLAGWLCMACSEKAKAADALLAASEKEERKC